MRRTDVLALGVNCVICREREKISQHRMVVVVLLSAV
jgi:hypothetical protein